MVKLGVSFLFGSVYVVAPTVFVLGSVAVYSYLTHWFHFKVTK